MMLLPDRVWDALSVVRDCTQCRCCAFAGGRELCLRRAVRDCEQAVFRDVKKSTSRGDLGWQRRQTRDVEGKVL